MNNCIAVGAGVLTCTVKGNPLLPVQRQRLKLIQDVQINVDWSRSIVEQAPIKQSFWDFHNSEVSDALDLQLLIEAERQVTRIASNAISLAHSAQVSGGRVLTASTVAPPQAEFTSDTEKGMPVYVVSANSVDLAQADIITTSKVMGLAGQSHLAGETGEIINAGWVERDNWTIVTGNTALTPNTYYYLSSSTEGRLSETPPESGFLVTVGLALDEKTMFVLISNPIQL